MDEPLSNDDRRELLRTALAYEAEAERTGRRAFQQFAQELRRFAWTGAAHSDSSPSSSLTGSGASV
jgi:hypothetical protein